MKRFLRNERTLLRVLGVATLVVLLFPSIVAIAMISIVGIPLGIGLAAAPTLFLLALGGRAGRVLARRDSLLAGLAGAAAMLALLAAGASFFNALLERRADALARDDHDDLERPLRARNLAVLRTAPWRSRKDASACDGLCQRLLLSGAVDRFLHAELPREGSETAPPAWSATTPALSFRLERREGCPSVVLGDDDEPSAIEAGRSAPEEMRLAIASGQCLVEEPSTLGDSDFVLEAVHLHRGTGKLDSGLVPWADTLVAERVALHQRVGAGFEERYRWTGVQTLQHPWILVPTVDGGAELRMHAVLARSPVRRNERPFAANGRMVPDLGLLLRDVAGLELPATTGDAPDRLALVAAILDREGAWTRNDQRVVEDLFEELAALRRHRSPRAEGSEAARREALRRTALRAFADPRVVPPRRTSALVEETVDAGGRDLDVLASLLFARLATTDPELREDHPGYLGWPLDYVALGVASLPAAAVEPHRDALERLANDPAARKRGSRALVRLAVFGADAVPTLLMLADEAGRMAASAPPKDRDRDRWERPLDAAFEAMCLVAPGAPALPEALRKRLRDGTIPSPRRHGAMLVSIFVQAGADPEPLHAFLDEEKTPESRQRFDRMVASARSRPSCRH